nr:MAG TPA: hypothetical protein [Bacteriophage sp.]
MQTEALPHGPQEPKGPIYRLTEFSLRPPRLSGFYFPRKNSGHPLYT